MKKQISIIGCGWLGLPLAKHLIAQDHIVKGSTTSKSKLDLLETSEIEGFYVKITSEGINGDIESCLAGSDILILNIPPGLRQDPKANFVQRMGFLMPYIETSAIKKVLFVSSTSVYEDSELMPIITEDTTPNPESESGKHLLQVESLLMENKAFSTTVLRFGGLFGADRHPATFISGRTNLKNPDAPVNLIHRYDCVHICAEIIKQDLFGDTFNAVTIPHPSKKEYYTAVCKSMHLPLPQFDMSSLSKGKRIDSKKLMQALNYTFEVTLNN